MPCFVAQSFVLAAFATLVCQRTKLQKATLFAAVCRFFVTQSFGLCNTPRCLHSLWFGRHDRFGTRLFAGGRVVQEWGWRTSRGMFCVVFMWFLRGCGAGLGARGSRVFVSFFIYFICSPSNNFLFFYSV